MKTTEIVDFTKFEPHTLGPGARLIATCPICGRRGSHKAYGGGKHSMVHAGRFEVINGVRWVRVLEHCTTTSVEAGRR